MINDAEVNDGQIKHREWEQRTFSSQIGDKKRWKRAYERETSSDCKGLGRPCQNAIHILHPESWLYQVFPAFSKFLVSFFFLFFLSLRCIFIKQKVKTWFDSALASTFPYRDGESWRNNISSPDCSLHPGEIKMQHGLDCQEGTSRSWTGCRIRSRLQVVFRNVEAGPQKTGAGDLALLAPYGQGTLAPAPGIAPRLTNRTNGLRN